MLDADERREAPRKRGGRDASRLPVRRRRVAGGELEPVPERRPEDREPVAAAAGRAREGSRRASRPRSPATPRERSACGVRASASARIASAIPGASRSSTVRVASGVTSRGANPVPPVVSTSNAPASASSAIAPAIVVGVVRNDAALDVEPLAREELLEHVAARVLANAGVHAVGDGEHGGLHAGSFVFSTSRTSSIDHLLVDRLRHVVDGQRRDASPRRAPPSRRRSAPSSRPTPRSRPRPSPTVERTSTCVSGSGWQSGMSSDVRFAAMIPASCAVTSASPFGRSREPSRRSRAPCAPSPARRRAGATAASRRRRPSARRRTSSTWLRSLGGLGHGEIVDGRRP